MRKEVLLVLGLAAAAACGAPGTEGGEMANVQPDATIEWGMVMHGGAGTITPDNMTPELEAEYRAKLTEALEAGHAVLAGGGSSLDAVIASITILEDSPLFNAGKGAVFTADGSNSLDASIMDGVTGNAGAVAGVTTVRNPIVLARLVMDSSEHVLLSGPGAEEFGRLHGVAMVDPGYFYTDRRWQQLLDAQEAESEEAAPDTGAASSPDRYGTVSKYGTVGVGGFVRLYWMWGEKVGLMVDVMPTLGISPRPISGYVYGYMVTKIGFVFGIR